MKILEKKVMRGPNYWSNYRNRLIVMLLDIGELERFPTNKLDGFRERLEAMLPSLATHRCSEDHEGGFFHRVEKGTWMGHVIEHIALELQSLAGMETGFGRTRSADREGVYNVIFSYIYEKAGLYTADASVRMAEALVKGELYDVSEDIRQLQRIKEREQFGPSTQAIVDEAIRRNIPYKRLNSGSLIRFGYGANQKLIRASMTGMTSGLGIDIAGDKEETKQLLKKACIPVARGCLIRDEEELNGALEAIGFPLVIKPVDGNHGRGVTTGITMAAQALAAFHTAKEISRTVMVESFVKGTDYRFLVINFKLVAVAERTPAKVTGDGISTIAQLIETVNTDPARGDGHTNVLTKITVDAITEKILSDKNLTLDTVLPEGEILFLKKAANLSSGGTSRDVTDDVHPYNVLMAERIARVLNLDICGVDVVATGVSEPITKETGAVIEVNACPGFRMHLAPSEGLPRNVAEPVMDMLYPQGKPARIPIVAITGTNGKTTTTRLIAHLARTAGHNVGYITTDGIYLHNQLIQAGDCTGPVSADVVLSDPMVDFAVLETARGGILRSGLGFDKCDISIVTNVTEDHLGLKGIHTLREMAKVKIVVARSTAEDGYAVLNADDDLVYAMRRELDCSIALFSVQENSERIARHCERGGIAAIVENGYLTICRGNWKSRVERIENIPLAFGGSAECMVKNLLPSVLAAFLRNFELETIRTALTTFIPSPEFTPGRLNLFAFKNFNLVIDYAHNAAGFAALKTFVDRQPARIKTGIVAGVGDRRDEDIADVGRYAARMFNNVIIRHDKDTRGRERDEITALIRKGINEINPDLPVTVISDEMEAISYAILTAEEGAFITVCTDEVMTAIAFVKDAQEKERQDHPIYTLAKVS